MAAARPSLVGPWSGSEVDPGYAEANPWTPGDTLHLEVLGQRGRKRGEAIAVILAEGPRARFFEAKVLAADAQKLRDELVRGGKVHWFRMSVGRAAEDKETKFKGDPVYTIHRWRIMNRDAVLPDLDKVKWLKGDRREKVVKKIKGLVTGAQGRTPRACKEDEAGPRSGGERRSRPTAPQGGAPAEARPGAAGPRGSRPRRSASASTVRPEVEGEPWSGGAGEEAEGPHPLPGGSAARPQLVPHGGARLAVEGVARDLEELRDSVERDRDGVVHTARERGGARLPELPPGVEGGSGARGGPGGGELDAAGVPAKKESVGGAGGRKAFQGAPEGGARGLTLPGQAAACPL